MNSHADTDFSNRWLDSLRDKAEHMESEGASRITGGAPGEEPLATWKSHGVYCKHLPPDEHGILRISIGGGSETPVALNYCVIRGDYDQCISLLEQALRSLKRGPKA